jgi:hypothetical protein
MNVSNLDEDEAILAAKGLIHCFPEKVIDVLLEKCDAAKLLKRLCKSSDGVDYHQLIGEMNNRASDPNADVRFDRSRRLTNESLESRSMRTPLGRIPSDSTRTTKDGSSSSPPQKSSSSASVRHAASNPLRINVLQEEENQKLHGYVSDESYYLIRSDIVRDRLEETPKFLKTAINASYGDKPIHSDQIVRLTWEMRTESKTHQNYFLVISPPNLLDADIIIGGSEPEKHLLLGSPGSSSEIQAR